jgi:hypothetical protein
MPSKSNGVKIALMAVLAAVAATVLSQRPAGARGTGAERLAVVWSSGDPDVAHKVRLMYAHAAKTAGWFDEVELVVWGPSSRLLAADKELQKKLKTMMADAVVVRACVACADMYGVADRLRVLGIDVKGMGAPLSEMLKRDWMTLTF